ncbi:MULTISPECIES: glycoside hydrolase family 16 protein [Pseudoalteromonas]|uniref:Hydrolase n=1 Tax=Pseudoalteromonas amylolytica TaxID=1859457 RepID=A0A1S1N1D3_9GAMM|nr:MULTISPECIES: glycoside hydrolase family 16 protein [Pseudoalteromonas]OHU90224.1 hydrolase [Pseudoalteromonas sp. JW3]OHU92409.1 hydrolase [Pseudoalteromonas amylolytica]
MIINKLLKLSITTLSIVTVHSATAQNAVMFDDFSYKTFAHAQENGWQARTETGHPGLKGAKWWQEGVSFHPDALDHNNTVMRLTSKTDGSAQNTRHTQVCHKRKYRDGTYAARVYFNDQPQYGPDGDGIVETFYAISPLAAPMDPDYSEMDFEYLANGGWGKGNKTLFATSWETFKLNPFTQVHEHSTVQKSLQGWNTLLLQVADNQLHYYINGELFAEHSSKVYPEVAMSINFNLWFIAEQILQSTEMRQYYQDIDWVYFIKDTKLDTQTVMSKVAKLREKNIQQLDTVPDWQPKLDDYCSL